ncbi:MAG: S8 family serine peptidase [bacterium]|nr:S8 family serine peptidase [bacterium]
MKYFRPISVISILILIVSMNACGSGDPAVNSLNNNYSSDLDNMNLNTGNVGLDGLVVDNCQESAKVLPGSSHLVTVPSNPDGSGFHATCSAGSWRLDGGMVGNEAESVDGSFEWVAPANEVEAQLIIKPYAAAKDDLYGLVVIVSVNPGEIDLSQDEPVHEIMFTDMATGYSAPAAEGELLVKLTPQASITEILSLRTAQDYRVIERISRDEPIFRMKFDPGVDLNSAMQEIAADSRVEVVEPNYFAYPAMQPTDPMYSEKFEFPKIDAEQAWDIETGSSEVWVAVVDTGVDRNHPDLAGNVVNGADFVSGGDGYGGETPGDGIDNNDDGYIDQNVGHGTHVAGIIAAEANNGVGACGIAFDVTILPLRIFPSNGDTGATFSSIIDAVNYASNVANVKVISMSIGATYESSLLQSTINTAWAKGKVIVAAAANANTNQPYYPAAHENVVAVAALSKNGQRASFSNYGSWVDISAYGTAIFSTFFDNDYKYLIMIFSILFFFQLS